jgi:hypothetical protein
VNEDDMEALEPLAGEDLERMLARYARVRLEPSQALARRARTAVMEEAWRRRLDPHSVLRAPAPSAGSRTAAASGASHRLPFSGWGSRRVAIAFAAASLTGLMLGSSVFAASRAGGPLYEPRLTLESLTLPSDPAARVAAQLERADARLGEAVEAGFRHDEGAVAAALDAYDRAIADLTTASGAAADEALQAIQLHRAVLLQLAAQVPDTALSGIDTALENSNRVIVHLAEAGAGRPDGSGNNGAPQGNGFGAGGGGNASGGAGVGSDGGNAGGNQNGNANGTGNGNGGVGSGNGTGPGPGGGPDQGAGQPTPTPVPAATAAPTEKPNTGPQASHDPDRTPKPHRTPPDGGSSPDIGSPTESQGDQP